jgi:hypothetical protein
VITEQAPLAQLHAALQVAFGWSDEHLYVFQIRGWQFGDPARAIELALAGGGVDMPLAAFAFEVNEAFQYHYNLIVPWKIDCRIESGTVKIGGAQKPGPAIHDGKHRIDGPKHGYISVAAELVGVFTPPFLTVPNDIRLPHSVNR